MKLAPPLALLALTGLLTTGCATRQVSPSSAPALPSPSADTRVHSRAKLINAAAHALYQTGAYATPADARQAAERNAASLAFAERPEDRWVAQTAEAESRRFAQENVERALARAVMP